VRKTAAQQRQEDHEAWLAAHPPQTTTVTITVGRETRTIEASTRRNIDETHFLAIDGVAGTIGAGSARYPATLLLHRLREGQSARSRGTLVTDSEGRQWTYHMQTCIRNRQARIVGWADTAGITNYQDQERTK